MSEPFVHSRILLDTNAWLDAIGASGRLQPHARSLLEDASIQKYFSAVSLWEIVLKCSIGKLTLPFALTELETILAKQGVAILGFAARHAITIAQVRGVVSEHRDPFDHALIAVAICEDLPILTSDAMYKKYSMITVIQSRAT